jgi:hypothetical protein
MMNKKDIVELVQWHDVDHVFDLVRFLYKLEYTKWKNALRKSFFSDFNLTPNSSLICLVELNSRFFVSKTVDWYLFKRLFRLTIVEWLSGRTVVIGSGYESKSLNRKNKIHFHVSKLTSTNLVPLDEFDVALKNRKFRFIQKWQWIFYLI